MAITLPIRTGLSCSPKVLIANSFSGRGVSSTARLPTASKGDVTPVSRAATASETATAAAPARSPANPPAIQRREVGGAGCSPDGRCETSVVWGMEGVRSGPVRGWVRVDHNLYDIGCAVAGPPILGLDESSSVDRGRDMRRLGTGVRAAGLAAGLVLALAGCSSTAAPIRPTAADQRPPDQDSSRMTAAGPGPRGPGSRGPGRASGDQAGRSRYAVPAPGRLRTPLRTADILVTSTRTIPGSVRRRVDAVPGVAGTVAISLASLSANGRTLSIAAADPARFRRFTQYDTAVSDAVWSRVADGEVAVDPSLPPRLADRRGYLRLGTSKHAPAVHIGAYAPLVRQISAVVNPARGRQLGMPHSNALVVSTGTSTPSAVTGALRKVLGPGPTMSTLALEFDPDVLATAVLSGGSVSRAVGTFNYTSHPDGTVTPDARWVRAYIRRETMPIIGPVTGNKGMLPQLRAALEEVVRRGLASSIHPAEFGGCYVPRFIGHDPALGLSLHSWGMACDLNVPGNLRGSVGQMDRRVVAIFERWGFAWGGTWSYTDPMHFEMNRVVKVH